MGQAKRRGTFEERKAQAMKDLGLRTGEPFFMVPNTVKLTPVLIEHLQAEKGMKKDDLKYAASKGAQYCEERNSIVFPAEFEMFDEDEEDDESTED